MKSSLRINSRTRFLADCSIACAAGLVLSYMRLFTMPQGGSVTLAPLPVIAVSMVSGLRAGAVTGLLLGTLKILTGGHIVGWVQAALDYPAAYAALSASAFAPKDDARAAVTAASAAFALKTALHVYSGYLFFGGSLKASLVYNLSYSLPEFALCSLALYALVKNGALRSIRGEA